MEDVTRRYETDLRLGEFLRFQAYMLLFRLRAWPLLVIYGLVLAYIIFQIGSGAVAFRESLRPLAITGAVPLLLLLAVLVGGKRTYDSVWKPQIPIVYSFDSEGVTTSATHFASKIRWSGISEERVWAGLWLLFLHRQAALVVPVRCLGQDVPGLRGYAEAARREAKASSPGSGPSRP